MLKLRVSHDREDVADLFLPARLTRPKSDCMPAVVSITSRFDSERERVETFIRSVFAERYGARVNVGYPMLMSVRDDHNRIHGAVGFRPAQGNTLFLEQYLASPIEAEICGALGRSGGGHRPLARDQIVEVGNLASDGCGASLFLFVALASFLHQQRFAYVAATSTKALARQFKLARIDARTLAPARTEAIGSAAREWGTYYDTEPSVMFGAIAPGVEALENAYGTRYELRPQLLARVHHPRSTAAVMS